MKSNKQRTLVSLILAVVLAAAIAIGVWFGISSKYSIFNLDTSMESQKTLTVTVNQYGYNTKLDKIEAECEKVLNKFNVAYEMKGKMTGDESEIVYVFDAKTDLSAAETALEAAFQTATNKDGVLEGLDITVATSSVAVEANIAQNYVLRAAIAGAVLLVLAFVYVSFRYKVGAGLLTAICGLLGAAVTTAVVVLARIPVTVSVSYVIVVSAMLSMVTTLLTLNKARINQQSNENADASAEDQVAASVACKEILALTVLGGVSLILVGAIATTAVRWFAIMALIGLVVSAVIGLFFAPAWYVLVKKVSMNKAASKKEYKGAKKTSKKEKKTYAPAKKEAVKETAPVAEEAVEEVNEEVEEAPVAEEPAEEVAEEVEATEETVEENVEEAPVEETAEEVAEEEKPATADEE